jgi:hypothetical protein
MIIIIHVKKIAIEIEFIKKNVRWKLLGKILYKKIPGMPEIRKMDRDVEKLWERTRVICLPLP